MIEQCFNFSNRLPASNESLTSTIIYQHGTRFFLIVLVIVIASRTRKVKNVAEQYTSGVTLIVDTKKPELVILHGEKLGPES